MIDGGVVFGILALVLGVNGDCNTCNTAYKTERDAAGATAAQKCTALKTYLGCLETELTAAEPCVLSTSALAGEITTDFTAIAETCTLTDTCTCQKAFFETHLTATGGADCTATKKRISCLKGKTEVGCGGTKTVTTLAAASEAYLGRLTGCALTGAAAACACELTYAKADISTNGNKCQANKQYVGCLRDKTGSGCVDTVITLATAASTTLTGLGETDCPLIDSACYCDMKYAVTDISNTAKCNALKNELTCLLGRTGTACDNTTLSEIATSIGTSIGTTGCTLTTICTCQLNYQKTVITNACSAATDFYTCVDSVTTTTQFGCDGMTQQSTHKAIATGLKAVACAASDIRVVPILLLLPLAISHP